MSLTSLMRLNDQVVYSSVMHKRDQFQVLLDAALKHPQIEMPVTHRFANGLYLREIFMPAGSLVIGHIHTTQHFNVILTGAVSLVTADTDPEFLEAPHTFVSEAGTQKVLYIHEDCQWQTHHVTDDRDVERLEQTLKVDSHDQLEVDTLLARTGFERSNAREVLV